MHNLVRTNPTGIQRVVELRKNSYKTFIDHQDNFVCGSCETTPPWRVVVVASYWKPAHGKRIADNKKGLELESSVELSRDGFGSYPRHLVAEHRSANEWQRRQTNTCAEGRVVPHVMEGEREAPPSP